MILAGVNTEKGIHSALIDKKLIDPNKKKLGSVKMQILKSRRMLEISPPECCEKKKKIIELFGKGLSVSEIMAEAKTSTSYTIQCLIGAQLMKRKYSRKTY